MNNQNAIDVIQEFKNDSLKKRFSDLEKEIVGKERKSIPSKEELYKAAILIKKVSSQIDEIVHASGIVNSLNYILEDDEKVEKLSLAADSSLAEFDLETNKRIAEYKFARWHEKNGNGTRRNHAFADLAKLFVYQTEKRKQFYTISSEQVISFFKGKAKWRTSLKNNEILKNTVDEYLKSIGKSELEFVKEIFEISNVEVIDIENLKQQKKPADNNG